MSITQEKLLEMFNYREDGFLIYKIARPGCIVGNTLGYLHKDGYYHTMVLGKSYLVHRLIYLYHYGVLPPILDHINIIRTDNKIENLREASSTLSNVNRTLPKSNTSGNKGVAYTYNRWVGTFKSKGIYYRKSIKASKEDQAAKDTIIQWLKEKRIELHGEFVHHG
jgi:hypothetical protein